MIYFLVIFTLRYIYSATLYIVPVNVVLLNFQIKWHGIYYYELTVCRTLKTVLVGTIVIRIWRSFVASVCTGMSHLTHHFFFFFFPIPPTNLSPYIRVWYASPFTPIWQQFWMRSVCGCCRDCVCVCVCVQIDHGDRKWPRKFFEPKWKLFHL